MTSPPARAALESLRPYRAAALDETVVHNLSANEASLGPSAAALQAAAEAMRSIDRYPDGGCTRLRQAIAKRFGLDPDRIVCGAGSEELITLLVLAYAAYGDDILFSQYGFIKYELAARACGARPVRAPECDFHTDVDALLDAVTPRTRVLFLANPNNPTGTFLPDAEVRRLRAGLRQDVLLVVDAAYAEFVESATYADGLALATDTDNTIALRTFSKIHGLAGLRCGWGYAAAPIVETLHKVRGAFNVGSVTQAAAAAAISDDTHVRRAREHNAVWLRWVGERLARAGLEVVPSVCNFLFVRFADDAACRAAQEALRRRGVLANPMDGYGRPEALRITIGTEEANRAIVDALTEERP